MFYFVRETKARSLIDYNICCHHYHYHYHYFGRWRPPRHIRERSQSEHEDIQQRYHIFVEGEDVPPPIKHFRVCGFKKIFFLYKLYI